MVLAPPGTGGPLLASSFSLDDVTGQGFQLGGGHLPLSQSPDRILHQGPGPAASILHPVERDVGGFSEVGVGGVLPQSLGVGGGVQEVVGNLEGKPNGLPVAVQRPKGPGRGACGNSPHAQGRPQEGRTVTIRAGVQVRQKVHKAPGGLIRATTEVQDGVLVSASLSGDFFFFPPEKLGDLEAALVGVSVEDVENARRQFPGRARLTGSWEELYRRAWTTPVLPSNTRHALKLAY